MRPREIVSQQTLSLRRAGRGTQHSTRPLQTATASGWDVESEGAAASAAAMATPSPMAGAGARMVPAGPQADWGGIWVGLLGVSTVLVFVHLIFSIDLVKNLYEYNGGGPASGLINSISGMFFSK